MRDRRAASTDLAASASRWRTSEMPAALPARRRGRMVEALHACMPSAEPAAGSSGGGRGWASRVGASEPGAQLASMFQVHPLVTAHLVRR